MGAPNRFLIAQWTAVSKIEKKTVVVRNIGEHDPALIKSSERVLRTRRNNDITACTSKIGPRCPHREGFEPLSGHKLAPKKKIKIIK